MAKILKELKKQQINNVENKTTRKQETIKKYENDNAGTTYVNLLDGTFNHKINLGTVKENTLKVPLIQIFDYKLFNKTSLDNSEKHMKRGWKTNLHQYLIKKAYDEDDQCRTIFYLDDEGKKHEIKERWYYEVDGIKTYVGKDKVFIDSDNKLKYKDSSNNIYDVTYDVESEKGLSYISASSISNYYSKTDLEFFNNFFIKFADGKGYEISFDENGKFKIPLYYYYDKNNEKNYIYPDSIIYNDGKTMYLKNDSSTIVYKETNNDNLTQLYASQDGIKYVASKIGGFLIASNAYMTLSNKEKAFELADVYVTEEMAQLEEQIKQIKEMFENYDITIKELITQLNKTEDNELKEEILTKYKYYLKEWYKYYNTANELLIKRKNLIENQKQQVNDFLVDENENILGFDGYGRLILIGDKYENEINIEYGKNDNFNKILSINSTNQKIIFNYNEDTNLLSSIIDEKGRITKYEYIQDDIIITLKDNYKINFSCKEDRFLSMNSLQNLLSIYILENKVNKVIMNSSLYNLIDTKLQKNESGSREIFYDRYEHLDNATTINDSIIIQTYKFDEEGRLINIISSDNKEFFCEYNDNQQLNYSCNFKTTNIITTLEDLNDKTFVVAKNDQFDINSIIFDLYKIIGLKINLNEITENKNCTIQFIFKNGENVIHTYNKEITCNTLEPIFVPCAIPFSKFDKLTINFSTALNGTATLIKTKGTIYEYYNELLQTKTNGFETTIYKYDENKNVARINITDHYNREQTINYIYNSENLPIFVKDNLGNCEEYKYDEFKNLIMKKTYNIKNPTLCNIEKTEYDNNGNIISKNNCLKEDTRTKYYYNKTNMLNKIIYPNAQTVYYDYDYYTDEMTAISSFVDESLNQNLIENNYGVVTAYSNNNSIVRYDYDSFKRVINITIGSKNYCCKSYEEKLNLILSSGTIKKATIEKTTFASGDYIYLTYDEENKLREYNYNGNITEYFYDDEKRLIKIDSIDSILDKTIVYLTDGNIYHEFNNYLSKMYEYDDFGRTNHLITIGKGYSEDETYYYLNNRLNLIKTLSLSSSHSINYSYDLLYRPVLESISYNNLFLTNQYKYLQCENQVTNLIKEHIVNINDIKINKTKYNYDLNGNIVEILSDENKINYKYDKLNRLIREDNKLLNKTFIIDYDENGNIFSKKEYEYTFDEPNQLIKNNSYEYHTGLFKDKLKSFNNQLIEYDDYNRLKTYKNMIVTMENQNLIRRFEYYDKEDRCIFSYDGNFVRSSKSSHFGEVNFLNDGNKVLKMDVYLNDYPSSSWIFRYSIDKVIGFKYNDDEYFYVRNIQGDITHIYKFDGTLICKYVYDAYGNHKVILADGTEDTQFDSIGNINPFRYRSYFFDFETKLYWLNTRFYDSEIGRFISQDSIEYLDPQSINGLNLFAYCNNNPIMYSDGSGHSPDSIWKTLLGVAVGIGLAVVTVAAVVASGGTLFVPVLVGAGVGAGFNLVGQGVSNISQGKGFFEDINWGNVALGGLSGAAFATGVGGLWGAVAIGATSNAGMSALEGNSWANIGFSALVGGASAFAGFKLGKFVSNKLLNINTNLGIGDYANMARVDGAGFLSRNVVALMSKLYTLGPTIVTGVGRGVTKFVGNYIGDCF